MYHRELLDGSQRWPLRARKHLPAPLVIPRGPIRGRERGWFRAGPRFASAHHATTSPRLLFCFCAPAMPKSLSATWSRRSLRSPAITSMPESIRIR